MRRANDFLAPTERSLGDRLGFGRDGIVWTIECQSQSPPESIQSALKAHANVSSYQRERDVYRRLRLRGITAIRQHNVPQLLGSDDELMVVEMSVVCPPFVLDFADAYLDRPPTFSDEALEEWREEKKEQFGSHWREVQRVLHSLEAIGIYMTDVKPGNVEFAD
jgi:hypothetical protein